MSGGLFISYRRSDTQSATGRLADHLRRNGFGDRGDMFLDIDSRIPPGVDFRVVINETLAGCDLVIVVMGQHWLDASDSKGRRRLDRTSDTHRLEVAAALNSAARVIPVLVEGASHPSEEDLPDDLKDLAYLQSWSLDERNYAADVETLAHQMLEARRQMEAERDRVAAEAAERERLAAEAAAAEKERQETERERLAAETAAAEKERERLAAGAATVEQERERVEADETERARVAAAEKERAEAAADQIAQLSALHDQGKLTDEEYSPVAGEVKEGAEVAAAENEGEQAATESAERARIAEGEHQKQGARTHDQIDTTSGSEADKSGVSARTRPDYVNTMLRIGEVVLTWVISSFIGAMLVLGLMSLWDRSAPGSVVGVVIVLGIAAVVSSLGLWAVSRFRRTQSDYINTMLRIAEIALKWVVPALIALFLALGLVVLVTGEVQFDVWFEAAWKLGFPGALAFWGGWVVGRHRRRRQQETASAS